MGHQPPEVQPEPLAEALRQDDILRHPVEDDRLLGQVQFRRVIPQPVIRQLVKRADVFAVVHQHAFRFAVRHRGGKRFPTIHSLPPS